MLTSKVIAILLLLWALYPNNPYGFYIFLRIVICGICSVITYNFYRNGNINWAWVFGLTAVVYNPIIRIYLTRKIWTFINIITIIVLVITIIIHKKQINPTKKDSD
jgi:hypothetical protein